MEVIDTNTFGWGGFNLCVFLLVLKTDIFCVNKLYQLLRIIGRCGVKNTNMMLSIKAITSSDTSNPKSNMTSIAGLLFIKDLNPIWPPQQDYIIYHSIPSVHFIISTLLSKKYLL